MIVKGEKFHVIYRRILDHETRRHFVGEVVDVLGSTVKLTGFVYISDTTKNQYHKKAEIRTTIIDLSESGYIVNLLPSSINIHNLEYALNNNKQLVLCDNKGFSLDINEFGPIR